MKLFSRLHVQSSAERWHHKCRRFRAQLLFSHSLRDVRFYHGRTLAQRVAEQFREISEMRQT